MRLVGMNEDRAGHRLAAEIEGPEVPLGAARADRAPEAVAVAVPQPLEPGNRLALQRADFGGVVRPGIGIAEVVDEIASETSETGGREGEVVGVAHVAGMGRHDALLGAVERVVEVDRTEARPHCPNRLDGVHHAPPGPAWTTSSSRTRGR